MRCVKDKVESSIVGTLVPCLIRGSLFHGLLQSTHNWLVFHPLYTLNNQVPLFYCSFDLLELYGFRIGYLEALGPIAQIFKAPMPKATSPY